MTPLKIYGFAPSTYTQTALMVARQAGVEPELCPLEFKKPSHFSLHPYGKMPAMQHGEVTLFETLAIASYIDRVVGGSKLQPTEPACHARMLQWISVAIDYAYEDLVSRLHDDKPSPEALAAAGAQLKLLDAGLAGRAWFADDQPTLADVFLYPMVEFAVGKLGDSVRTGLPALAGWRARASQQRGMRKAG